MVDLTARLREWLGIPHTEDAVKQQIGRELREQRARLARLDATLPRARHSQTFPHPRRRATDARRW